MFIEACLFLRSSFSLSSSSYSSSSLSSLYSGRAVNVLERPTFFSVVFNHFSTVANKKCGSAHSAGVTAPRRNVQVYKRRKACLKIGMLLVQPLRSDYECEIMAFVLSSRRPIRRPISRYWYNSVAAADIVQGGGRASWDVE